MAIERLENQLEAIRLKLDAASPLNMPLLEAEAAAGRLQLSHDKLLALVDELTPRIERIAAGNETTLDLLIRMRAAIALADGWGLRAERDTPSPGGVATSDSKT